MVNGPETEKWDPPQHQVEGTQTPVTGREVLSQMSWRDMEFEALQDVLGEWLPCSV